MSPVRSRSPAPIPSTTCRDSGAPPTAVFAALCPKVCPRASSSRRAASRKSPGDTMLYRSNTERVLWPVIIIATRSGMPARTRFLTAVRLKSCGIRPGHPAARHASIHRFRKLPIDLGFCDALRAVREPLLPRISQNTHGSIVPALFSFSCSACCALSTSRSSCVNGKTRPSSFLRHLPSPAVAARTDFLDLQPDSALHLQLRGFRVLWLSPQLRHPRCRAASTQLQRSGAKQSAGAGGDGGCPSEPPTKPRQAFLSLRPCRTAVARGRRLRHR